MVAVAVEILAEDGLEVFQRCAIARQVVADIGDEVAVTVEAPDRKDTELPTSCQATS